MAGRKRPNPRAVPHLVQSAFWESITVRLTRIRIHSRSFTGRNPALDYFSDRESNPKH